MQPITLLTKEVTLAGTGLFRFTKPTGFTHEAGQSIDLTLINPTETDSEGNSRTFSIVSAPQDPELLVATRMRDTAFKRVLKRMPEGTEVLLDGPFGSFTLHENVTRPAIFLAGGIGVTPFYSMIADATTRELPHTITLLYSNRRPEEAALLSELKTLEKQNPQFTLVATMTGEGTPAQHWEGERGHINSAMLAAQVPPGTMPLYYLAGPQPFVTAMRKVLKEAGISNDDLRFEEFAGY